MTLQDARNKVAEFWTDNAYAVHKEDEYASHVSQEQKDMILMNSLEFAEQIAAGKQDHNFTVHQRIQYYMTGICQPLLS